MLNLNEVHFETFPFVALIQVVTKELFSVYRSVSVNGEDYVSRLRDYLLRSEIETLNLGLLFIIRSS